jgi:hypothetical protein
MFTQLGTIELKVDPSWRRYNEMASGNMYEPMLQQELINNLSKDDVFYNVGSRWGIFSLIANRCGVDSEKIHNFEADKRNYDILLRNIPDSMKSTRAFVGNNQSDEHITLDNYAKHHQYPTVMKMDIEGSELNALLGAENILKRSSPELFVEVHPEYISDLGKSQEELIDLLKKSGYEIQITDHELVKSGWTDLDDIETPSVGTYMIHAVKSEC